MPIGAHVSTAGGLSTCVGRARALGAEGPQLWQLPQHTDEQVQEFGRLLGETQIGPNFAHAAYLINLASTDPLIRQRSVENLSASLGWAERVGRGAVVVRV